MKIRNKQTGEIREISEKELEQYGLGGKLNKLGVKNSLWNNIRANKGSGKKPTKEMLKQEKKIRAAEKAYGGYMQMGGGLTDEYMAMGGYMNPYMTYGGYLPMAQEGVKQWASYSGAKDKAKGYWDRFLKANLFQRPSEEAVDPRMQTAFEKIIPFYGKEAEGFGDWAKTLFTIPQNEMNNLLTGYYESPAQTIQRYNPTFTGTKKSLTSIATDPMMYPELPYAIGKGIVKGTVKAAPYVAKGATKAGEYAIKTAEKAAPYIKQGLKLATEFASKYLGKIPPEAIYNIASRITQAGLHTNESATPEDVAKIMSSSNNKQPKISQPVNKSAKQNTEIKPVYEKIDTVGTYQGMPLIQSKEDFAYGGYMSQGGINNPGFRALPKDVQQNIIDNMAVGGCMSCGGKMQGGGNVSIKQIEKDAKWKPSDKKYIPLPPAPIVDYPPSYIIDETLPPITPQPFNYPIGRYNLPGTYVQTPEFAEGGKMPQWLAEVRFKAAGKEDELGDYGYLDEAGDGKWIQKAINPKHKGYCTPMTKSTCTPRRKALAKTLKKMAKNRKADGGYALGGTYEMTDAQIKELQKAGYGLRIV